jgi:hypothetical protein
VSFGLDHEVGARAIAFPDETEVILDIPFEIMRENEEKLMS